MLVVCKWRGTLGFAVLQYRTFCMWYFGNFKLKMRYCCILRACRMWFFSILMAFSSFQLDIPSKTLVVMESSNFIIIIVIMMEEFVAFCLLFSLIQHRNLLADLVCSSFLCCFLAKKLCLPAHFCRF